MGILTDEHSVGTVVGYHAGMHAYICIHSYNCMYSHSAWHEYTSLITTECV